MIETIFCIVFLVVVYIVYKGVSCMKNHSETSED